MTSNGFQEKITLGTGYKEKVSLQHVFFYDSSNLYLNKMTLKALFANLEHRILQWLEFWEKLCFVLLESPQNKILSIFYMKGWVLEVKC